MKALPVLLTGALVVAGGFAIHFTREREAGRGRLAALELQMQELELRNSTVLSRPLSLPFAPPIADSPAPGVSIQPAVEVPVVQVQSPDMTTRRREVGRTILNHGNPDLAEALGMTDDEAERLLDLLQTHVENIGALGLRGPDDNVAGTLEERTAVMVTRIQENEAELQAFLGNRYSRWKDYNEVRTAWQLRRDLRAELEAEGMPMTDTQSKALITGLVESVRIFNQERPGVSARLGVVSGGGLMLITSGQRQTLMDAGAPHLTPLQRESYRRVLDAAVAGRRTPGVF